MLAENEQVHVLPGHFAQKVPFHIPVFAEIQESIVRSLSEGVWEVFSEHDRLLSPDCKAIRIIPVTGEERKVVEGVALPVGIHYLT